MAVIHVLDKHTAELIAAGEVVERPASAVKELVENAIDAGAHQIDVSIERGGIACIEVSDDGSGIEAEYLATAFIRHATSKIEHGEDLERIGTLGFRGEALASIASVARVQLVTCTAQDEFACCYTIEGGQERGLEPAARGIGTTITVRDLFYNTPARMKFLKKDSSEGTFVAEAVQRLALSHPEIAFQFTRDGRRQFKTPGDGSLRGAVYAVLGREFANDLLEVQSAQPPYEVTGLITPPRAGRASRGMQYFYVNGRFVKNRTMMAALENAYKGTLMQGRFPGCVLELQLPPELVDVNVHPAKTEVRFAREREVFDAVYRAAKQALAAPGSAEQVFRFAAGQKKAEERWETSEKQNGFTAETSEKTGAAQAAARPGRPDEAAESPKTGAQPPAAEPGGGPSFPPGSLPDAVFGAGSGFGSLSQNRLGGAVAFRSAPHFWDESAESAQSAGGAEEAPRAPRLPLGSEALLDIPVEPLPGQEGTAAGLAAQPSDSAQPSESAQPAYPAQPGLPQGLTQAPEQGEPAGPPDVPEAAQTTFDPAPAEPPLRYIGEAFQTYIITQREDTLCLIDKHAAHERILYEQLAASYGEVSSQLLLEPVPVNLSAEEKQAVLQYDSLLRSAGIEAEDFGGCTVLVRAVPADLEAKDVEDLLVELAAKLARGARDALSEKTEWVLHSIACKAAVKAGDRSHPAELLRLAQDILAGRVPPFCPHGRPVVLKLTKKELEKQFGRMG